MCIPVEFTNKLIEKSQIAKICSEIRSKKRRSFSAMVFFDILHIGHKRHLHAAKNEADILIVSLTVDRHVNKGPGRPIFAEKLRAEMVASLACVDFVVLNDEPDAITMIGDVKPDVYFKGDEYKFERADVSGMIMKERLAVEELGGEIRYSTELTFSSSNIAKKTFSKLSDEVQEYLLNIERNSTLTNCIAQRNALKTERCS